MAWDGSLADGPFSGERRGSICLDGLTHAIDSRQGCRDVFAGQSHTLTCIALGPVQAGVFCFKEGFGCEKSEGRPMKDRLCPDTTPVPRAIKSVAANDGP